jgi:hypothetical protein
MCEAMFAISGERRSYEEEVEERTLRIRFAIPMMPFGKRFGVFLHAQIRSSSY